MCSPEAQPWRANFTGPKCRCGVPMPGNDEERAIDQENRKRVTDENLKAFRSNLERERSQRINNLFQRYGY